MTTRTAKLIKRLKKQADRYNEKGDMAVRQEVKDKYYQLADEAQSRIVNLELGFTERQGE